MSSTKGCWDTTGRVEGELDRSCILGCGYGIWRTNSGRGRTRICFETDFPNVSKKINHRVAVSLRRDRLCPGVAMEYGRPAMENSSCEKDPHLFRRNSTTERQGMRVSGPATLPKGALHLRGGINAPQENHGNYNIILFLYGRWVCIRVEMV